ncbi:MAG: acyl-ACP--UDP-N-acetylglucosamine O-acyltransferase [Verrucomicrobia bacterium]|nr:acyl-ACP--UDP-N-acetylglucosamine O-acyltransferase [Verrucomicrobiota bacterium]
METIHPTAIIHPQARLGARCRIGPYCVIGEHVQLGDDCWLHSHVVLDGHTRLGQANEIFPFASIGLKTQDLKWKPGGVTRTEIGDRNTFREYVTVHSATGDGEVTNVGSDNHILAYCHLAHNVTVGHRVIMSNVATLAGHVTVEDHAVIGGLVAIHQFCRVGKMAMIGGCSKVVQDIPPFMIADGNAARTVTVNKVGLERNGVSEEAQTALRQAYKILFRAGLTIPNALAQIESELPPLPELAYLVKFVRSSERGISK